MEVRTLPLSILWTILISLFSQVTSSGVFELRLNSFRNDLRVNSDGNCCRGIRSREGVCTSSCRTFFRICLNHYQTQISPDPPCTFGTVTTPVFTEDNFDFPDTLLSFSNPVRFPFDFAWPGTFALIIEAWHDTTEETPSTGSPRELISKMAGQHSLRVQEDWTNNNDQRDSISLDYSFRVVCDEHYYGPACKELCKPRNDRFGHYTCSENGTIVCREGWTGPYCTEVLCLPGCHSEHGHCTTPFECRCSMGWRGRFCDECVPYPGCQRGTCELEFQCICEEGWGGMFCNQDLNYCTHNTPCVNGATCTNTGEGSYTCQCMHGYTGTNCEMEIDDCLIQPCHNNGTCADTGSDYICQCPQGFHGRHCESSATSCEEDPCKNGAPCVSLADEGYRCSCLPGFTGVNCEAQLDECATQPCLNGGRCIDDFNGYHCDCPPGYGGSRCELNHNDCSLNPCLNMGSCIDKVNDFECRCVPGFVGKLCQYNADDCRNDPCANGASCHDLLNDFRCDCAPGFTGKDCSVNMDDCAVSPCHNGGVCIDRVSGFECRCLRGFYGMRCEIGGDNSTFVSTTTSRPTTGTTTTTAGGSTSRPTTVHAREPDTTSSSGSLPEKSPTGAASVRNESVITLKQLLLIICLGIGIPIVVIVAIIVFLLISRKRNSRQPPGAERKDNEQNERTNINNKLRSLDTNVVNSIPHSNVCVKVTNEEQAVSKKTCNTTSKHHNSAVPSHLSQIKQDNLSAANITPRTSSPSNAHDILEDQDLYKPPGGWKRNPGKAINTDRHTPPPVPVRQGSLCYKDKLSLGPHSMVHAEGMLATEV